MRGWLRFLAGRRNGRPAFTAGAPLESLHYAVIDTEMTSLDSRANRLLPVGAVAMNGPKIRLPEQIYRVVNAGAGAGGPGVLVHGLRPCDLELGDPHAQVLEELRRFIDGAVLVGHFAGLDLKVLDKELGGAAGALENAAIDTARVHRWILRHRGYAEDLAQ